jgi:predicted SprT family Zn-dependent metalloprotease
MPLSPPFSDEPWPERISAWAESWGVPGLERRVAIALSARMRTSLGRCIPSRAEVRIAQFVLEGPDALVEEVLCHELAHVAVAELHGAGVRAHGGEWRALMQRAGRKPRARIPASELEVAIPHGQSSRVLWAHRCLSCEMTHMAGRPVKSWRCKACRQRGLSGELLISRVGRPRSEGGRPAGSHGARLY